jgi:hypothetical protein
MGEKKEKIMCGKGKNFGQGKVGVVEIVCHQRHRIFTYQVSLM